jgi:hypothetical protein
MFFGCNAHICWWPKNKKVFLDNFLWLASSKLKFNVGIAFTYRIQMCSSQDTNWNPVRSTVSKKENRFIKQNLNLKNYKN